MKISPRFARLFVFVLFFFSQAAFLLATEQPTVLNAIYPLLLAEQKNNIGNEASLIIKTTRTEGVAPLGISFDLVDSLFADEDMLMLAEFMWDFGDEGDDYNIGKGYCPSHVYRRPGSYTARVTAYYNGAVIATASVQITVTEFTGTTYYIAANGSDSNDGLTESTAFATPAYAFKNFYSPNVRFRLRQGDTFSQSAGLLFGAYDGVTMEGPVLIDSYKDSTNPSDLKPVIYDTRVDAGFTSILGLLNCVDFRVVNIKFQASGGGVENRVAGAMYPSGIQMSVNGPCSNCLVLDCDVLGTGPHAVKPEGTGIIIQDCTVRDGGSYGVYMANGTNCAFIGMSMQEFANDSPEYTMRLSHHIVKCYIAYCDLRGDYTNNTFQLRGDDSSYNYVWKNQFDRFVGINQTNNEEDETLHHNTFDSNITVMRDYEGNTRGSFDERGFFFSSNYSMCRNNIVYGFDIGFYINTHDIVGGCTKLWYHNNTVIAKRENSSFIAINKDAKHVELKNNIFYNMAETASYSDRFINVITEYTDLATDLTQIDSDYNVFIGEGWGSKDSQIIVGVAYYTGDPTLAVWRSDFSNGLSSRFANALLSVTMDTDDVTASLVDGFASVGTGSPAIEAGDTSQIYTKFDFFGNERTDLTIGAIGR